MNVLSEVEIFDAFGRLSMWLMQQSFDSIFQKSVIHRMTLFLPEKHRENKRKNSSHSSEGLGFKRFFDRKSVCVLQLRGRGEAHGDRESDCGHVLPRRDDHIPIHCGADQLLSVSKNDDSELW